MMAEADSPSSAVTGLQGRFADERRQIDEALERALPPTDAFPEALHEAMRYSLFAGGKRLRPILVLAAGEACGSRPEPLLPAACAVELIHTYSLIHDDLPAFDDDALRRGQPTNHKVYGEAVAILAGDALQSLAFEQLAAAAAGAADAAPWSEAAAELARAAGSRGMAGGQCADIAAENTPLGLEELEAMHAAKTGALLTACVRIGAVLAGADDDTRDGITAYGRAVGLAFQIVDDILDVEGSVEALGKEPGVDLDRGKSTYPGLMGLDAARAEADRLHRVARDAVAPLGERAAKLVDIAAFIVERSR